MEKDMMKKNTDDEAWVINILLNFSFFSISYI